MTRSHSNVVFDDPRRQRPARLLADVIGLLFCALCGLLVTAAIWLVLL